MGAQGLFAFFFLLNWGMITHTKGTDLLCLQHSGSALRQGLPEARVPQLSGHLRLATVLGPTGLPAGALLARPRVPGAQRRGSPAGARARRCSPAWGGGGGGGGPTGRGGPAGGRGFARTLPAAFPAPRDPPPSVVRPRRVATVFACDAAGLPRGQSTLPNGPLVSRGSCRLRLVTPSLSPPMMDPGLGEFGVCVI